MGVMGVTLEATDAGVGRVEAGLALGVRPKALRRSFLEFCRDSLCFCMAPLANFSAARSLADSGWTLKVGPASSSKALGVEAIFPKVISGEKPFSPGSNAGVLTIG